MAKTKTTQNTKNTPTRTVSLRVTDAERNELERAAGSTALSAFIHARLFGAPLPKRRTRGKAPVRDHRHLAQILGMLGRSGLPAHVGEMAELARSGSLPVDAETETALRRACADIQVMRTTLIAALGLNTGDKPQ